MANNVEIIIPVPSDVDSPSFKVRARGEANARMCHVQLRLSCVAWVHLQATVGTVTYVPDLDAIVWSIKQFYGGREYLMRAHFGLPSTSTELEADKWKVRARAYGIPCPRSFAATG